MKRIYKKIQKKVLIRKNKNLVVGLFILGAQKSGTTSLFNYLHQCSNNLAIPNQKELYFFSERVENGWGLDDYHCCFPMSCKNKILAEATPDYLFYHKTAERIAKYNPAAKLIVILRDPVDRAYSQYCFQNFTKKTVAYDPLSFHDAILNEEKRFHVDRRSNYFYEYKYYSYKARGRYYDQLVRFYQYFDKKNILILDFNELANNPLEITKKACRFANLTLNDQKIGTFTVSNMTEKSLMSPNDEKYLIDYFRPHNTKLFELIGSKMAWKGM